MTIKESIKQEASECAKSAEDMRNAPQHREIFYVVSIILNGIADRVDTEEQKQPGDLNV